MGKKNRRKNQTNKPARNQNAAKGKALDRDYTYDFSFETDTSGQDAPVRSETLYSRYKDATLRVKIALQSLAPSCFNLQKSESTSVNNLTDAAEFIERGKLPLENKAQLLSDLKTAINFRTKYAQQFRDGGDLGHSYFVAVLNYCLQILKTCPSAARNNNPKTVETEISATKEEDTTANAFSALTVSEDDSEDEEDDNETGTNVKRPEPPEKLPNLLLSSFINFIPDKIHALCFFEMLDYRMGMMTEVFRSIKKKLREVGTGTADNGQYFLELAGIGPGQAISHCLKEVQRLEAQLVTECPRLDSTYKVLATAFPPIPVHEIPILVRMYSPIGDKFEDGMALDLVASIYEIVFRGGKAQDVNHLCKQFNKKWRVPPQPAELFSKIGFGAFQVILKASCTKMEKCMYDHADAHLVQDKDWFQCFPNLSGGKSFLNTLKLLDLYSSYMWDVKNGKKSAIMYTVVDFLPKQWNEATNPARQLREDLDGTITQAIYVFLGIAWQASPNNQAAPLEKDFLPFVWMARSWLNERNKPIPFSLAFAIHVVATSIFEVQGDGDVSRLAKMGQTFVQNYVSQLSILVETPGNSPSDSTVKKVLKNVIDYVRDVTDLQAIKDRTHFIGAVLHECSPEEVYPVAMWNPACTAMLIYHTVMGLNVFVGCRMLDKDKRTTMTIHLYHALRHRNMIGGDIPYVSMLDKYLTPCKAIWNGWEKPQEGKFVYRYFLNAGSDHKSCKCQQERTRAACVGGPGPDKIENSINLTRWEENVRAEDIVKSYRLMALNDMTLCAPYRLPGASEAQAGSLKESETRLLSSLIFLRQESDLLQTNLLGLGNLLDDLLEQLFPSTSEGLQQSRSILLQRGGGSVKEGGGLNELGEESAEMLEKWNSVRNVLGYLDYMEKIPDQDKLMKYLQRVSEQFESFFRNIDQSKIRMGVPVV